MKCLRNRKCPSSRIPGISTRTRTPKPLDGINSCQQSGCYPRTAWGPKQCQACSAAMGGVDSLSFRSPTSAHSRHYNRTSTPSQSGCLVGGPPYKCYECRASTWIRQPFIRIIGPAFSGSTTSTNKSCRANSCV